MLTLLKTEDGSHTLYNKHLNEHYHSTHGAIQESRHVFINAGMKKILERRKKIHILEIGFGTGLNCLLTWIEANRSEAIVHYTALEPFPLSAELVSALNYPEVLQETELSALFEIMHGLPEGRKDCGNQFILERTLSTLHEYDFSLPVDLIYFDAFAPNVQPELWTEEMFVKMAGLLIPGGILVTYCAKGEVKRNMKRAGLIVERLPGPPGKREMTRASKQG